MQGRSQKFIVDEYNFLLHDTTVLYTSSLMTSAAISAQKIVRDWFWKGIYIDIPSIAMPLTQWYSQVSSS